MGIVSDKDNKFFLFLLLLILLVSSGVRIWKVQEKGGYFIDEYTTITRANYTEFGWEKAFTKEGRYYTGREIKQKIFSDDNTLSGVWSDVKKLRESIRDSAHPNLFYILFKVSLLNIDSGDLDNVTKRAFMLNFFLFLISFFFLFKLCWLLFPDNNILLLLVLGVAYLSPVGVENTMYFRPYQLQETLLVVCSFMFAKYYLSIQDKESVKSVRDFFLFGLAIALFMLSGFFSIVYVALLVGVLILFLCKERRFKDVLLFFGMVVSACVVTSICYPLYFDNLLGGDRGKEALGVISNLDIVFANLKESLLGLSRQVKANYIGIPLAVFTMLVVAFWVFKKVMKRGEDNNQRLVLILIVVALVWLFSVFYVAPFKVMRYGAPVFPILSLSFSFICSFFKSKEQILVSVVFVVLFLGKTLTTKELYWERRIPDATYEANSHIPLIVAGVPHYWMEMSLTPFYTDERLISITTENADFFKQELDKHDSIYVFIYKDNYLWAHFNPKIADHEIISDILHGDIGWYYKGYLLKNTKNRKTEEN